MQAEFEKNIPFALSVAQSAEDPDDPVSVGRAHGRNFRVDSFDVSYGDPQTVAVMAKRALRPSRCSYRINGGRTRIATAPSGRAASATATRTTTTTPSTAAPSAAPGR